LIEREMLLMRKNNSNNLMRREVINLLSNPQMNSLNLPSSMKKSSILREVCTMLYSLISRVSMFTEFNLLEEFKREKIPSQKLFHKTQLNNNSNLNLMYPINHLN